MADNNFDDQTNLQTPSNDNINYDYTYKLYYNSKLCVSNDNSRNIITFIKDNNEDNLYRSVQTFYIDVINTQNPTDKQQEICNNKGIDATDEDSNENVESIYFSNRYIYIRLADNSNYSPNSHTYNFYIVLSDEVFGNDDTHTNTNHYYPNSESIEYYFNGRILPYEIDSNFTNSISVNIYDKNVISSYSNIYELEETVKNACISKYGFAVNIKNIANTPISENIFGNENKFDIDIHSHILDLRMALINYYDIKNASKNYKNDFHEELTNYESTGYGKFIGVEKHNNSNDDNELINTDGNSSGNLDGNTDINKTNINKMYSIYFYNSTLQEVFTDNFPENNNPYTYINTRPVNMDPNSSASNLFDSLEMLHMLIAKKYSDYDYD